MAVEINLEDTSRKRFQNMEKPPRTSDKEQYLEGTATELNSRFAFEANASYTAADGSSRAPELAVSELHARVDAEALAVMNIPAHASKEKTSAPYKVLPRLL